MKVRTFLAWSIVIFSLAFLAPYSAFAHCDSLDGPVVKAAQKALDTQNVDLVLVWVQPEDEAEIRSAYNKTLTVRALGQMAKELADTYFYETVVRLHRAGEGAPYTGLKPAGRDLGPAIRAADQAIDSRSLSSVEKLLATTLSERLRKHFEEAANLKGYQAGDVKAGREYVKAYVEFIHYVERLYEAITAPSHGQFGEPHDLERP
ncbi:MAG TPA: DUF6448 family protein [Terriglobia bacterium]|nr:DUF6448 family protein [Terriglobia bacterium]